MKFDKFSIVQEIKDNLIANGYFRTTDIQFKAIPPILNGEDVLAIAQTGSGKTAAFAIPIIHEVHVSKSTNKSQFIQCLVMVPTRELSQQIGGVFAKLSKNTKANSFAIYGGVEQDAQIKQLQGGIDILIATPGRMFDLINQNIIDISHVNILVLDEADRMLDLGFIDDIEKIKQSLRRQHQTLFFSATINKKIKRLAYSQIRSNALRIQIAPDKVVSKNIQHFIVKAEMEQKRFLLLNFLNDHNESKIIIFVRTQVRAERVKNFLLKNNINSEVIHGGMKQEDRETSLEKFRNLPNGFLIATDVTARGIDLPKINYVINYDLPDHPENYIHRIGRTGRGFDKGEAFSFCSPDERIKLEEIEEFLGFSVPVAKADQNYFESAQKTVSEMSLSELVAYEEAQMTPVKNQKNKKSKK